MCRLLSIHSQTPFAIAGHLSKFAQVAQNSQEYQGHGWGCAWQQDGSWQMYKNINPIWEDSFDQFGRTTRLIAHARSAFRDEGIQIENNMPFRKQDIIFIFNGELHGVRIKSEGRIGAEKIFNYILRFTKSNLFEALQKGTEIICKRSAYVRAINIIMADCQKVYVSSTFNEMPEYFTMHEKIQNEQTIICSAPYLNETGWHPILNNSTKEYSL